VSNTTTQFSEVTEQADLRREPLASEGKRYVVRDPMAAVIFLALALGSARTLGWYNAWLYASVVLLIKVSSGLVLSRVNPAVLNARGTRHAMSVRERIFFSVFIPSWLAIPIVAGVDVGGAGWTHRSEVALAAGLALVLAGTSLVAWATGVNAFFEKTVRIQHDRGQRVCTSGPYGFVRHPGYTGAIMAVSGVPLALGSFWCFVPVVVMAIALIVRTAYEDRLLRAELDGYEAYAARTRYRLCPFVW
jgi:protein-S-isoprenylcysteine O-methyltransferase Ste14